MAFGLIRQTLNNEAQRHAACLLQAAVGEVAPVHAGTVQSRRHSHVRGARQDGVRRRRKYVRAADAVGGGRVRRTHV